MINLGSTKVENAMSVRVRSRLLDTILEHYDWDISDVWVLLAELAELSESAFYRKLLRQQVALIKKDDPDEHAHFSTATSIKYVGKKNFQKVFQLNTCTHDYDRTGLQLLSSIRVSRTPMITVGCAVKPFNQKCVREELMDAVGESTSIKVLENPNYLDSDQLYDYCTDLQNELGLSGALYNLVVSSTRNISYQEDQPRMRQLVVTSQGVGGFVLDDFDKPRKLVDPQDAITYAFLEVCGLPVTNTLGKNFVDKALATDSENN